MIALPLLAASVALAGCTAGSGSAAAPTPSATTPAGPAADPVAVTPGQLDRILTRVSSRVAAADAANDAAIAAERLAGPALVARTADYTIRKADPAQPAPRAVPARSVEVLLPQAKKGWPRTVFTVVGDPKDEKVAPLAMMLIQQSPRTQYQAQYLVELQPNARVPDLAPANVGAPRVAPDVTYLTVRPDQVGADYYDVLLNGETSTKYPLFDESKDQGLKALGPEFRAQRKNDTQGAPLNYTMAEGAGPTIVFSSVDTGAIVAVDIDDIETVTPSEPGSTVNALGQVKLLSGLTQSSKGIQSTYGLQLLFSIPPQSQQDGKVTLLGYSSELIASKEVG